MKKKPTGTLYGGIKIAASGSTVTSEYVKFTAADDLSGISKVYVKKNFLMRLSKKY